MIFVTGDTHGDFLIRFGADAFPEQKEMTKDDYVVICGDFGGVWDFRPFFGGDDYVLDMLDKKPFTTLFVPGNHENYDRLTGIKDEKLLNSWLFADLSKEEKDKFKAGCPRKEWHGGFVREIRPSILMLEAGVFDVDGHKCFAYGGAQSHDINGGILDPADFVMEEQFELAYQDLCADIYLPFRVKGVSWWEQEQPGKEIEMQALTSLSKVNNEVDLIFTHDCSSSDRALLGYGDGITRINEFLEEIKQTITYKHWFFGHLHDNRNLPGNKEHLIYEQIIQIG